MWTGSRRSRPRLIAMARRPAGNAAAALHGAVAAGVGPRPSGPEDARERLRTRYARVLVAAARAALSRRDLAGAIDLAERALAEDPLDDSALAVMLDALVKAGRVSGGEETVSPVRREMRGADGGAARPELVALAGELGIAEDR